MDMGIIRTLSVYFLFLCVTRLTKFGRYFKIIFYSTPVQTITTAVFCNNKYYKMSSRSTISLVAIYLAGV